MHHFPFVPAVFSEGIWRLRLSEIPLFVQEIIGTATSIKEKQTNKPTNNDFMQKYPCCIFKLVRMGEQCEFYLPSAAP